MKLRYTAVSLLLALLCLLAACGKGAGQASQASQSAAMTMTALPVQRSAKNKGKPFFTGKFVAQADKVNAVTDSGDSAIQKMKVGRADITLGRFQTNHGVEAYLDQYGGGDFEINRSINLPGDIDGTHYRWRSGSKTKQTVVDAVVAEANGYCLMFLCRDSLDAFRGADKRGPNEAAVNGWIKNLTVKYNRAPNPMTAKGKKAAVSYKALKKKNQTIPAGRAYTVNKAQGKVCYKKTGGSKRIAVAKTGKLTVKKGLRKGAYKVKVKVTAAGNAGYKPGSSAVTVTVNVK